MRPPTYRTLPAVMGPVDMRGDIPEWAERYAVGDDIGFRDPETAKLVTARLVGFSSMDEHRGLPVVDLAETDFSASTRWLVLRELDHVLPEVVRAARRRSGDTSG